MIWFQFQEHVNNLHCSIQLTARPVPWTRTVDVCQNPWMGHLSLQHVGKGLMSMALHPLLAPNLLDPMPTLLTLRHKQLTSAPQDSGLGVAGGGALLVYSSYVCCTNQIIFIGNKHDYMLTDSSACSFREVRKLDAVQFTLSTL